MILRRIANGIKNQDWFVVLIELVVVVLGIYIGLQVDDWNKERQDRVEEKQYLVRLLDDFNDSIALQERDLNFLRENRKVFQTVIDLLRMGELKEENRAAFEEGLWEGGRVNPFVLNRTTIKELQSSGRIGLISNLSLRQALGELDSQYEYRSLQIQYPYESLKDAQSIFFQFVQKIRTPENGRAVNYDFQEMVASPEALEAAYIIQSSYIQIIFFHEDFHKKTVLTRDELLNFIENQSRGTEMEPEE